MGRTVEEFFSQPQLWQDLWNNMLHVITKMRAHGVSLPAASREFGISPRTVIRLGGTALRRLPSGRYVVKAKDHLLRVLVVLTSKGLQEIAVRDSRTASLISEHWAAVQFYLQTGDASRLRQFRDKVVMDADGERFLLLTNLEELDRLGNLGLLSFESMYAQNPF